MLCRQELYYGPQYPAEQQKRCVSAKLQMAHKAVAAAGAASKDTAELLTQVTGLPLHEVQAPTAEFELYDSCVVCL